MSTYTQHAATEQALADQWMLDHGAELEAEIQVGDDTGRSVANPRPESDKALMTDVLTGQLRERQILSATETTFKVSELPSSDLSGVDPESIGFYVATRNQSELATQPVICEDFLVFTLKLPAIVSSHLGAAQKSPRHMYKAAF